MIKNRLKKTYRHLSKWAKKHEIEAFRLYDKDIPEFPYFIDLYKDHAVVYERGKALDIDDPRPSDNFTIISDALEEVAQITQENIVLKARTRQKGSAQYGQISNKNKFFPILEHGTPLLVNLWDYLDTGLFLDHRPLRQMIHKMAKNKRFLNLFAYTGSVSVFAALGGAHCTTVDLSNTYLSWAKKNFVLNKIDPAGHDFIKADALDYLEGSSKEGVFDLIFLDPPTFSNSKSMDETFEVQRDHRDLIYKTMQRLHPSGLLIFSNNKRGFKIDPSLGKDFKVIEISKKTIPEDFRDMKVHVCFEIRHI
jgi:23S rRNA (cytosine1962-C5)-methyltransferase/23S rRNA (guanine2445-N2)-methyltransferase / 23S rRNA (guanine2069-N7)-methyltransferase